MKFTKASAAGNDFILIDNRKKKLSGTEQDFFRDICRRRYSIGADGVILLESSTRADFHYRHFNSDGLPAAMCGNGARCISRFAYERNIAGAELSFEINGVIYKAICRAESITVIFPYPKSADTKMKIFPESPLREAGFINTGVPHYVIFTDDVDDVNVEEEGKKYRSHPEFKQGTNVDFVEISDGHSLKIRTFERGVEAETLACGTGAAASAVIANLKNSVSPPVRVETRGGLLEIDWDSRKKTLLLTGTADLVYEGELRRTAK